MSVGESATHRSGRRARCVLLIVLGMGGVACAHPSVVTPAGTPAPPAPLLSAIAITPAGYHNETSLAIDPADAQHVVAAWQIPATVAASADGGATWHAQPLPGVTRWQLAGDPVVGFDRAGHAYAVYIAFDRPADYDTLGRAAHRNGIFLNRSDDGGRTWRETPTPVVQQPERPGIPFEDKPNFVAAPPSATLPGGGVDVAWTEFRRWQTVIRFARSTDGGRSFSPAITISDRPGSPKDSVGADEGTTLAVGHDGTVYVAWSDSTGVWLDRSRDGGRTFGRDVLVARTPDIVFGVPGVARANGYPSLRIDPRSGRLYVLWVDVRRGSPEPFLATSDDGGTTWSAPRLVPPLAAGDSAPRFFAWLAVDPHTGLVAASYYRVAGPGLLDYMLATSTDAGRTFVERRWSNAPFAPRGEFLGDYTGLDALDGVALAAWTEIMRPATSRAPAGVRGGHHARVVIGRAVLHPRTVATPTR